MTNSLVKADAIQLIHSLPQAVEHRDKAIIAVCGEILAGLEQKKQALRERMEVLKKEQTVLDEKIKEASEAFRKKPERFFKDDIAGMKALAGKFKWGALKFECEINWSSADDVLATLEVDRKDAAAYRNGMEITRKVVLSEEILKLAGEKENLSKALYEVNLELAKVENNIAKLPQTRMLVEASVAKHDLENDSVGRELYKAVRASFEKMMPQELRRLLPSIG